MGYDIALINLADENPVLASSHVDEKSQVAFRLHSPRWIFYMLHFKTISRQLTFLKSSPQEINVQGSEVWVMQNSSLSGGRGGFDHWFRLHAFRRASIYLLIFIWMPPVMTIFLARFYFCSWLDFRFALECALIGRCRVIRGFLLQDIDDNADVCVFFIVCNWQQIRFWISINV